MPERFIPGVREEHGYLQPFMSPSPAGPWIRYEPDHVIAALRTMRELIAIDGSEAIYLHSDPEKPPFGLLLRGKQKEIAEDALEAAGFTYAHSHSHIDGDD